MAEQAYVKVTGLQPLMEAFVRAGKDAPKFAATALWEEAQEAFALSQYRVPVRYGPLKASGVVHEPEINGSLVTCQITYGGTAATGETVGYALYVHEIPPSRARHDPPTAWKYLENPVKITAEGMGNRLVARVLDMLNRRFEA